MDAKEKADLATSILDLADILDNVYQAKGIVLCRRELVDMAVAVMFKLASSRNQAKESPHFDIEQIMKNLGRE